MNYKIFNKIIWKFKKKSLSLWHKSQTTQDNKFTAFQTHGSNGHGNTLSSIFLFPG